MSTVNTILILLALAIAIGILLLLFIFHNYEQEKRVCGNCANRDECLHYCWMRGWEVGTQTKACSLFVNKHKV